ncbi:MAG: ribosome assembly cofactor RimP [Erysipelothrix sp.]|nr:ribosome assembly cofactor RimP [Erysipelothrix sp.]
MEEYLKLLMPVAESLGLEIVDANLINKDLLELGLARLDFKPLNIDAVGEAAEAFGIAIDWAVGLDVGSAGAERMIEPENYSSLVDQYVLVKFKNPLLDADYVEGSVLSCTDETIVVAYRQKHALKNIEIPVENIAYLRLAVKL